MRGFFGVAFYFPKTNTNIGSLMRSTHILGGDFLAIVGQRIKNQASNTLRSERHIPLYIYKDFEDFYSHLPYNCQLVGVEMDARAVDIAKFCHPQRAVYQLQVSEGDLVFAPIRMEIPALAVAKARARITKSGHAYTPEKTKSFEAELRWHWQKGGHSMIPRTATAVEILCYLPKPKTAKKTQLFPITRPDLDNYAKAILDGLNGFAWEDDSQVCDLRIGKRYASGWGSPKIFIVIAPLVAA